MSECSSCYCLMLSDIRVVILESSLIRDWRVSETRFDTRLDDITDNETCSKISDSSNGLIFVSWVSIFIDDSTISSC